MFSEVCKDRVNCRCSVYIVYKIYLSLQNVLRYIGRCGLYVDLIVYILVEGGGQNLFYPYTMNFAFLMKTKIWLLACLSILLPIRELMLTVGFLVATDLIVGIWKAMKTGQKIRSRRMSDTITKLLLYQVAIISGFLIEHYIITDMIPVSKLISTVIAIIEFKSIIESIEAVTGKSLWDKIKTIVGRKSEDVMDAMMDSKPEAAKPETPAPAAAEPEKPIQAQAPVVDKPEDEPQDI